MKKNIIIIYLIVPIFFILCFSLYYSYIPNDAVQYSVLSHNLYFKGVFNDSYGVVPGWVQSPGWPIILGFFLLFLPLQSAAMIGTIFISSLLIYLIYRFVKNEYDSVLSLIVIVLLAANPLFLLISRSGLSEPIYTLLHFSLFKILYTLLIKKKKISWNIIIILILLSFLLILVRSEGILYFGYIFIILTIKAFQSTRSNRYFSLLKAFSYLLLVLVLLFPYGSLIKEKYGRFNIIPKITYNKRIGLVGKYLSKNHNITEYNSDRFQELSWFGLDEKTKSLYSENILNNEYYHLLKTCESSNSQNSSTFIINNIQNTMRVIFRSNPFPLVFIVFIISGIYYLFKDNKKILWCIFLWLLPSWYFLISHVEERFFFVMLPYLSFIAAYGVYSFLKGKNNNRFLIHLFMIVLILNSALYYKNYYMIQEKNNDYVYAAEILKEKIPSGKKVCAKMFFPTFMANLEFAKMPICNIDLLIQYLKKQRAEYLLLGEEVFNLRKEFSPIYDGLIPWNFQEITVINGSYQNFKLYKIRY